MTTEPKVERLTRLITEVTADLLAWSDDDSRAAFAEYLRSVK